MDQEPVDYLRTFGILPAEELYKEYINLSDEDRDTVHARAFVLRYEPHGYNDIEAIIATMQERHVQQQVEGSNLKQ